jgi:hypothetical protein
MRREYSIRLGALLLAASAAASTPCPPELAAIAGRVAHLRSVPPPFAPPCRVIPAARLHDELARKLRHDLPIPPDLFLAAVARMGFIEQPAPGLFDRLLDFYGSQVLGFYEPKADEMVLVDTPAAGAAQERLVWSHELEHAAQEHRFHLPSRLLRLRTDGDAQRAASAIAEGDAMLVMFLLNSPHAGGEDVLTQAERTLRAQATSFVAPAGIPEYFVQDLLFPYSEGFETVLRAYRRGGFAAVDDLLAKPPASTAVLLHPDRSPPGPPLLDGDLPAVPAGYSEVLTDTLGEWAMRFWLARREDSARAGELAAGWDADRLRLVRERAQPGHWALAWLLRCRSVAACAALRPVLQADLPGLLAHLSDAAPPQLAWSSAGRTLELRADWPGASPTSPAQHVPVPGRR